MRLRESPPWTLSYCLYLSFSFQFNLLTNQIAKSRIVPRPPSEEFLRAFFWASGFTGSKRPAMPGRPILEEDRCMAVWREVGVDDSKLLTPAVAKIAEFWGMTDARFGTVLGLPHSTINRLRLGGQSSELQLSLLRFQAVFCAFYAQRNRCVLATMSRCARGCRLKMLISPLARSILSKLAGSSQRFATMRTDISIESEIVPLADCPVSGQIQPNLPWTAKFQSAHFKISKDR